QESLLRWPGLVLPVRSVPLPQGAADRGAEFLHSDEFHGGKNFRALFGLREPILTARRDREGRAAPSLAWGNATARSWSFRIKSGAATLGRGRRPPPLVPATLGHRSRRAGLLHREGKSPWLGSYESKVTGTCCKWGENVISRARATVSRSC